MSTKFAKSTIRKIVQRILTEAPVTLDLARTPKDLSAVDAELAKVVATGGTKDNDPKDDVIITTHKPEGVAPVGELKPSQSSMNIKKAMAFVLNMLWDGNQELNAGGDLGAFISKDNFIMDGHHRWVATAMINPDMSMGGYRVDFPGEQLVSILNTMTKGLYGEMEGKEATGGFEQFKPAPMKKQLMEYLNAGVWGKMTPEDVTAVLQTFTAKEGEPPKQGEDLIDAAVLKMASNLEKVTFVTPPWASSREEMPVIDEPNVPKAANSLNAGEVDWSTPDTVPVGKAAAAANRKDDLIPENLRIKWGKIIK
jgi:hypothetical protein